MAVLGRTRALRRTLLRAAPAALVSIGLLVGAGCGSSGDSGSDPRAEVEDLGRQTLTSGSSAACQRTMTPRFLEQNFGGQGQTNTLEQCQVDSELPGEPFARQVSFRSLRVEGQNAVATISVTGGEADGSVIRIELVRERGRWMLDYFADIQIDRPRYDAAGRRDAIALGVPQREADCAVRRLRRFYST